MPLFLKSIDPALDIFGNEQALRYNSDQLNSDANLLLLNKFTPTAGIFPSTNLSFLSTTLKGFQFQHELTGSSVYGNFALRLYDKFGTSTNIFKYDEQSDTLTFLKNISSSGLSLTGNLSLNSNKIINLANGINNNDAVNLGQLNNAITGIGLSALSSNGLLVRTAANSYTSRTITVDSNLTVSNANGVSGNPLIGFASDVLTNSFTTTGGNVNATTGILKGNNLAAHNSGSIVALNSLSMNSNYITGLATPVNNQDAATKQYVDNNSGGALQSILHGYNTATYSTNVGVGDHLKFDGTVFTRGSNISLDTTTTYNTSTNTASIGRITLAAGKTYRLTGSINNVVSANYNATRWYNSDTNAALGLISGSPSPISTTDRAPGGVTVAYINTSVSTRVELRITWNAFSSVNGTGDAIGPAWFTVEEV